jgi:hypothetical protein
MARKKRRHPAVGKWIQTMTRKGGRARARALTPEQRKKIAASGGNARWHGSSAEERSAKMREVIRARWARKRKKP